MLKPELQERKKLAMEQFKTIKKELGFIEAEITTEDNYNNLIDLGPLEYKQEIESEDNIQENNRRLIKAYDTMYIVKYTEIDLNEDNPKCYYVYEYFSKSIKEWHYRQFRELEDMEYFIKNEEDRLYTCKECGKELYWFENDGDIRNRIHHYRINICSACINESKILQLLFNKV